MGVVKGFKGAGIFAKIAFVLLILAAIGAWIAYNSTGWGRCETGASDTHYGLWRRCSDSTYTPSCTILDGWALGKCFTYTGPTLGHIKCLYLIAKASNQGSDKHVHTLRKVVNEC